MNNIKIELRNRMTEELLDGLLVIRINIPAWKDFIFCYIYKFRAGNIQDSSRSRGNLVGRTGHEDTG